MKRTPLWRKLNAIVVMTSMTLTALPFDAYAQAMKPSAPAALTAPVSATATATATATDPVIKRAQDEYRVMKNPEISYEQYLASRAPTLRIISAHSHSRILPPAPAAQCQDGNFEAGLNPLVWSGLAGSNNAQMNPVLSLSSVPLSGGALNSSAAHQTLVMAGTDAYAPISTLAPSTPSSTRAVRIGNAAAGFGAEGLTKKFVVTQANMGFWYAVVLENPAGHPAADQPKFMVRVRDAAGNDISFKSGTARANLNANSNQVIADAANPFFKVSPTPGPGGAKVVYKDWTCASIDLGDLMGQVVTVEFITTDCAQGAHAGWAYVDEICGSCAGTPDGNITLSAAATSDCGVGKICFDYTVPKAAPSSGTTTIKLDVMQNGVVVKTLTSPTLNADGQYCFAIDPATLGVNVSLGGFDYAANASFAIGTYTGLATKPVGSKPDGIKQGKNNDYSLACSPPSDGNASTCCPPLIKNDLRNMFVQQAHPTGNGYLIQLSTSSAAYGHFLAGYNAYLALLKYLCPTVDHLQVTFSLYKTTGSGGPFVGAPLESFAVSVPGAPPAVHFTTAHSNNQWYGIQATTFGVDKAGRPVKCGFSEACNKDDRFTYNFQTANRTSGPAAAASGTSGTSGMPGATSGN